MKNQLLKHMKNLNVSFYGKDEKIEEMAFNLNGIDYLERKQLDSINNGQIVKSLRNINEKSKIFESKINLIKGEDFLLNPS